MEKVQLSKEEKRLLKELASGNYNKLVQRKDIGVINLLGVKGFIHSIETFDGPVVTGLSDYGKAYLEENPKLRNPSIFDDKKYIINTITSLVALTVAIIALFK